MLPKNQRLTRSEFDEIYKRTKVINAGRLLFRLHHSRNKEYGKKYSVVVGKKVAKLAVGRHLIKRRVYHLLKEHLDDLPKNSGIIIVAQKGFPHYSFNSLKDSFEKFLGFINK